MLVVRLKLNSFSTAGGILTVLIEESNEFREEGFESWVFVPVCLLRPEQVAQFFCPDESVAGHFIKVVF